MSSDTVESLKKELMPTGWDDLSIEEKVERMRQIVKSLANDVKLATETYGKFTEHRHDPQTGEPMIPARRTGYGPTIGYSMPIGREYF